MEFKLSEARLRELAQIEAEANCDIAAGSDWGQTLGTDSKQVANYVADEKLTEKLMAVLQERWSDVLSREEMQEMIHSFQDQLRDRVIEKLQSTQSA
jgi:hypothetical protein